MKLQVRDKDTGNWEYVFCYNPLNANPITTRTRRKALNQEDLGYFQARFGNHEFRVIGNNTDYVCCECGSKHPYIGKCTPTH